MGHVGGIRYAYMYSYTHGVKPNVNRINNTSMTNMLVYPNSVAHMSQLPMFLHTKLQLLAN